MSQLSRFFLYISLFLAAGCAECGGPDVDVDPSPDSGMDVGVDGDAAEPSDTESEPDTTSDDVAVDSATDTPIDIGADRDEDGVPDSIDNCPDAPNPGQEITDGNALGDACVWPNQQAPANSDPWIAEHHDDLQKMRPGFLVINFANGIGTNGNDNTDGGPIDEAYMRERTEGFLEILRQGSRHHGYANPEAEPFLDPYIVDIVDLQDDTDHANSALFPRGQLKPDGTRTVGYDELFTDEFAQHLGFEEEGEVLTLPDLVNRGMVHDIILMANQVDARPVNPDDQVTANILEVAGVIQVYDENLQQVDDTYVKNGVPWDRQTDTNYDEHTHNTMPWFGRTIRVYFLNASRGPGCLMHSLGHLLEWQYNESMVYAPDQPEHRMNVNPWMQPYFRSFADFDLDQRYGVPFSSLYAGGNDYTYSDCVDGVCSTLEYPEGTIPNFTGGCGNVHYPPGASRGYDYYPAQTIESTCETFMTPEETAAPVFSERWASLELDDDCGGRFLTYWAQNMPGKDNAAVQPDDTPMKNWWPFLYY